MLAYVTIAPYFSLRILTEIIYIELLKHILFRMFLVQELRLNDIQRKINFIKSLQVLAEYK